MNAISAGAQGPEHAEGPERVAFTFWEDAVLVQRSGRTFPLTYQKGLDLLVEICLRPYKGLHVLYDLLPIIDPAARSIARPTELELRNEGLYFDEPAWEIVEPETIRLCSQRLKQLEDELDFAISLGDLTRARNARTEIENIKKHLKAFIGIRGRPRRIDPEVDRVRTRITHRLADATEAIDAKDHELGDYIRRCVVVGTVCMFVPLISRPISFERYGRRPIGHYAVDSGYKTDNPTRPR